MPRAQITHPLDPLSAAEISAAVATVRATSPTPEIKDNMRFVEVVLLEQEKHVVSLADSYFFPTFEPCLVLKTNATGPVVPTKLPPRRAKLVIYNKKTNETSEWVVELSEDNSHETGSSSDGQNYYSTGKVISSKVVPDVQPPLVISVRPMHRVDDFRNPLFCPMENGYARLIEGIHMLVDLQNMVVTEFEDRKLVPLPPADQLRNYCRCETSTVVARSDVIKPLQIVQPEGPSFRIDGYYVEWQKWNFRIGFTSKEGLVLNSVAYIDGSSGRRYVAHRLSFVEMVVPYGDPDEPHYKKNAFDPGEQDLGKNAHSLKKGCDCLGYIKYSDAHLTNFTGGVERIQNCICLHDEDHEFLWKHQDWRTGRAEVRRSGRLTVSFICTIGNYDYGFYWHCMIGNYDYGFYWHFYQDGKIEAEVKLTGILSLGALMLGETRKYGTMMAPGLYAPTHQHFFVARMNMAVDSNQVRNTRTMNRNGQLTGYKLVPASNCLPLAGPKAMFLRRAAFLKHNLWVTPYTRDEMFPGGDFPNQNPRVGDGLATRVKQNRSLEEADIVLWYVFGNIHVPRPEDWPVMPVEHIGFMLMPHGFYNCSPAVDL